MNNDEILNELKTLVDRTPVPAEANSADLNAIQLIGLTAHFFGGFEGMTRLHNAFGKGGGDTSKLNRFWDRVGAWSA
jgi:hypothetical protein